MIRSALGTFLDARAWRPLAARVLLRELRGSPFRTPPYASDIERIRAAAQWLARAQDATPDGGVAGRYHLATGWTSSYPETTGYLIPTFLRLEHELGIPGFLERARRATSFLLGIQLPSGAFPGGEIAENRTQPSVFNTAQILNGLTAWHAESGDHSTLTAAKRAAEWLLEVQDKDGAWRRHTYGGIATTYTAHASCWLIEFGRHVGEPRYVEGGRRHLEWVMSHRDAETGWIDLAGFNSEEHRGRRASAHPVAYTLWGAMMAAEWLGDAERLEQARSSARSLATAVVDLKELPGVLDHRWNRRSRFECLTGNAQIALIWMHLYEREPEAILFEAVQLVLDRTRAAQAHGLHADLDGALAGSNPIWGEYIRLAYPNWATKFYVDALLSWRALDPPAPPERSGS